MVTVIECDTIGEAWQRAFDLIMQNGKSIRDDNEELIELLHLYSNYPSARIK